MNQQSSTDIMSRKNAKHSTRPYLSSIYATLAYKTTPAELAIAKHVWANGGILIVKELKQFYEKNMWIKKETPKLRTLCDRSYLLQLVPRSRCDPPLLMLDQIMYEQINKESNKESSAHEMIMTNGWNVAVTKPSAAPVKEFDANCKLDEVGAELGTTKTTPAPAVDHKTKDFYQKLSKKQRRRLRHIHFTSEFGEFASNLWIDVDPSAFIKATHRLTHVEPEEEDELRQLRKAARAEKIKSKSSYQTTTHAFAQRMEDMWINHFDDPYEPPLFTYAGRDVGYNEVHWDCAPPMFPDSRLWSGMMSTIPKLLDNKFAGAVVGVSAVVTPPGIPDVPCEADAPPPPPKPHEAGRPTRKNARKGKAMKTQNLSTSASADGISEVEREGGSPFVNLKRYHAAPMPNGFSHTFLFEGTETHLKPAPARTQKINKSIWFIYFKLRPASWAP